VGFGVPRLRLSRFMMHAGGALVRVRLGFAQPANVGVGVLARQALRLLLERQRPRLALTRALLALPGAVAELGVIHNAVLCREPW
jgi:hypothetical protein